MNPFHDWKFNLACTTILFPVILFQGSGWALIYASLCYANSIMLFDKEGE